MRKLILEEWVSLDGYAADKDGKLDFFPDTQANKLSDEDQLKFLESIDTIILGRKTYELFVDFWPTEKSKNEIIADRLNEISKIVFSNTLDKAPWGDCPQAQVLSGSAVDQVRRLMQQEGKNIVLWGSITLAQDLLRADLIDEIHLQVCPTAIGGGRLLFPERASYKNLKLTDVKSYNTGVVNLHYELDLNTP
jgi:dihydrofolate reductase